MGVNEGATRYRVAQFIPFLKKDGFHVCNFPVHRGHRNPDDYWIVLKILSYLEIIILKTMAVFLVPFFDAVYLQRTILKYFSPGHEYFMRLLNRNIIFDFDDAIWLNYLNFKKNPVDTVLSISKYVVAGNNYLAQYAKRFNKNVFIIPTPVDTDSLKPLAKDNKLDKVIIGWTGTSSNFKYLRMVTPGLKSILQKFPDKVVIRILSNKRPDFFNFPFEFVPWSAEVENKIIASFDIGLMPLFDSEWARGKCAFKAIQYMAAGAVVVASPVGMNNDLINPQVGCLAGCDNDWIKILIELITNSQKRKQISHQARQFVEREFSVKSNYQKLKNLLRIALR